MKEQKKNQNPKNSFWLCKCGNRLGEFIIDNVIKIRGPIFQEYEIGFNYIEVICTHCHKKCRIESKKLESIQEYLEHLGKNKKLSKLVLNSGEAGMRTSAVRSLDDAGLKSFYSLEDRHKRILKNKLSEWQNKIYDCLCSMGLESNITDSESWDRVTKAISNRFKIPYSKVERDITKIGKEILKILRGT